MTKRAVVFSGGGAKGGYQIGAWKALNELGFKPDIVTGTSVGALNGALMALDKYDDAYDIWYNMGMDTVFAQFVGNTGNDENIGKLAKEVVLKGGADYTPLQELVKGLMEEDKLRHSPIEFGLVTTQLKAIKATQLYIEDIPYGEAADYVIASAACYPFMKSYKIGETKFVDGGYSDNMPVQMAIDKGATEIVLLNIANSEKFTPITEDGIILHYVHNKRPFEGTMMSFNKEISRNNITQGYLDTLKVFGKFDGYYYTFEKGEQYQADKYNEQFDKKFMQIYSNLPNATRLEHLGREAINGLFRDYRPFEFRHCSNVLTCAENAAEILGVNPREVYTFEQLNDIIIERLHQELNMQNYEQAESFAAALNKGISIDLLKTAVNGWDKTQLMLYAMQILLMDKINQSQKARLWLISILMPNVFCASLYCCEALKNMNDA